MELGRKLIGKRELPKEQKQLGKRTSFVYYGLLKKLYNVEYQYHDAMQ